MTKEVKSILSKLVSQTHVMINNPVNFEHMRATLLGANGTHTSCSVNDGSNFHTGRLEGLPLITLQ